MTKAATAAELPPTYAEYRDALVEHGILVASGVDGVYGRGHEFVRVLEGFDRYATEMGRDLNAEVFRFPPLITRTNFEKSDYLQSFPHLAGTVHSFHGSERDHLDMLHQVQLGNDWTPFFSATDVVLTPAACYPLYPMSTGTLPEEGRLFDVLSYCFRHEPSVDPARMQMFHQREYVRIGTPEQVQAFRDLWLERGMTMLTTLELDVSAVVANDPFFGRAGRMLAINQREQSLKFELVVPICSADAPTACLSCNYHQDHFGSIFDIVLPSGAPAHTACVGFGLERITLALFKTHGFDLARWPAIARTTLGL